MKFDMVHDIQKVYRKVLKAFSYPGSISSLAKESRKWAISIPCYNVTQIMASLLLDADTNSYFCTGNSEVALKMAQLTYCPQVDIEDARYIFVTRDMNENLAKIIEKANFGTLEDPQKGATIIVECDAILEKPMYLCQGPGIQDKSIIQIEGVGQWLDARNEKNSEFPLGVDMVFVDRQANCVVFPRTTRMERM